MNGLGGVFPRWSNDYIEIFEQLRLLALHVM
jgi:hypothetical protein